LYFICEEWIRGGRLLVGYSAASMMSQTNAALHAAEGIHVIICVERSHDPEAPVVGW